MHRGHFWTVAQHLRESLEQLQVPKDLIEECISNIAPAASVFPDPGAAPVPGPEPVPAEGTPAAVRKNVFFFVWESEGLRSEKKNSLSPSFPLSLLKIQKQELARQRAKESGAADAAACSTSAAAAAEAGDGQQDLAGD